MDDKNNIMLDDDHTIVVVDDEGNEVTMMILFTFSDERFQKDYVLYYNPEDESGEVFVSSFTEDGELLNISDEKEWDLIEEVFNAFQTHDDEDLVH